MKILVDENIPKMTVQALKEERHDVRDIRQTEYEGSDDEVLWEIERLFGIGVSYTRIIELTDQANLFTIVDK